MVRVHRRGRSGGGKGEGASRGPFPGLKQGGETEQVGGDIDPGGIYRGMVGLGDTQNCLSLFLQGGDL